MDLDQLKRFTFQRLLSEDTRSKTVHILGTLPGQGDRLDEHVPAIVSVERHHFDQSEVAHLASKRVVQLDTIGHNDVYYWLRGQLGGIGQDASDGVNSWDVKLTVICPATETHIRKYSRQTRAMVTETPQAYRSATLPYIEQIPRSRIQWVHNILDGLVEQDDILYNDPDPLTGFVLLPDSKWDRKTADSLYLLCICRDKTIRSIRDLRARHIPLLENIRTSISRVASDLYGVAGHQLRFFFHYQPSYYHLHVHITHIANNMLSGMAVGQAHLLDTVIDTLRLMDDYYERCTLTFALGTEHPLYASLSTAGASDAEKPASAV